MTKYLVFFFLILACSAYAQQASVWYFGDKAGVDFRQGKPVVLTDGVLSTQEGVATISDKNGKLLFYTDGTLVYNAQNKVMPNGKHLKGNSSSTQSAIIVPHITLPNQYYIFTVAAEAGKDGLCYTMVDMNLENGLGDVIPKSKNTLLHTPVTEKITAVKHKNGNDFWVIAHEWNSNKFLVYLVSEKGISAPIVNEVGSPHLPLRTDWSGYINTHGYMKCNPDGTNLALALSGNNEIEIFDFDSKTGKISNPTTIKVIVPQEKTAKPKGRFEIGTMTYGIEFSPNGSLLYVSTFAPSRVYQYNLQTAHKDTIANTQIEVGKADHLSALQLASDGKIYIVNGSKNCLDVIQAPNFKGKNCGYLPEVIKLQGRVGLGLPTFIQSFFEQKNEQNITYFDKNKFKKGDKVVLKNVQFAYSLATLQPSSFAELDALAEYMQKYPQVSIKLSGHTDNIGNKSTNIILSQNRANAVKAYLVGKKIADSRISFEGLGSSLPIATNDSDEGRAKNRRVEVEILE